MLDGVEVRRLWGPLHDLNFVLFEAPFGLLAGVLGVVVLLEGDVVDAVVPMVEGIVELVLNDLHVEVGIHLAIDLA